MKQFDVTVAVETHVTYRLTADTEDQAIREAIDKAERNQIGIVDDTQAVHVFDVQDTTAEM